jgi:beta-glucanase (GH16 family)
MKNSFKFLVYFLGTYFIVSTADLYAQCRGSLLFQDEFNGTSLDLAKWTYEIGNGCPGLCGWGNNEKQYYTSLSQNINVTGGYLNITARSSPNYLGSGSDFTSAKINTKNKFDRTYGRFEASIKMPIGTGLWPAFWMLPTNNEYGGWPTSGEIDIMEYRGDIQNRTSTALHYGNSWPNNLYDGASYTSTIVNYTQDFHEFAVEWEPGVMRFYVDNRLINTERQSPSTLSPANNNAVTWPWDKEFYMILNLAVGGWYPGDPSTGTILAQTTFPQSLQVDYVRVYDMTPTAVQAPFLGNALSIPGKIEAEYYNLGCTTFAYNDNTVGNTGNIFRSDDVDIEATVDAGGGYHVGWTAAGEWLNYHVNIINTGDYDIQFRVASNTNARSLHLELDGMDITGTVNVPNTGGWQAFKTVLLSSISLTSGTHQLRLVFDTQDININFINFALVNSLNIPPTVAITSPVNGSNFSSPATIVIEANASDSDGSIDKVEFYNGSSLLSTDTSVPYAYTLSGLGVGTYNLRAVAYDNELATASQTVTVNISFATSVEEDQQASSIFELYPNPSSDKTIVAFTVLEPGNTSLKLYNELGVEVFVLLNGDIAAGDYSFELLSRDFPPQVYTCIFQHRGRVVAKKMVRY